MDNTKLLAIAHLLAAGYGLESIPPADRVRFGQLTLEMVSNSRDFGFEREARALVITGRYIEAIKRHRELFNSSLKEAKGIVDRMRDRLRQQGEIPPQ